MNNLSKKGFTLNSLGPIAITLVVAVVVLGVGADILAKIGATQTANSVAHNSTLGGSSAIQTLVDYLPIIAIAIAAVIVLGIVMTYFGKAAGGR